MKILVITTSLRAHSNSDALAAQFIRGAQDAGHEVETISLKDKDIRFCKGCLACQRGAVKQMFLDGDCSKARANESRDERAQSLPSAAEARPEVRVCVIKDDVAPIIQKMHDADAICFATPIYYYEMSGQMKTLLDRGNPLYTTDYKFRNIYMLTTAAEDEPYVPERAVAGLTGWIDCFEKARLAGTVFVGGVNDPNEIVGNDKLKLAYELGNGIK